MMLRRFLVVVTIAGTAAVTGCNSGSTMPPPFFTGTRVTPSPTPSPAPNPATASGMLTTSTTTATSLTLGPIGPGDMGTTNCPATGVVSHLSVLFSLTPPGGAPAVNAMRRRPQNIGGAALAPFGFFSVTPDVNLTGPNVPAFSMTFRAGATLPNAANSYLAVYDPGNAAPGWNTVAGPGTQSGTTIFWTTSAFPFTLVAGRTYVFVAFATTSTLTVPTPTPAPQHLYAAFGADTNVSSRILQYTLPLTASSTPNFTLADDSAAEVAVDGKGDVAASGFSAAAPANTLWFYTAPLSGSSAPAATFENGGGASQFAAPGVRQIAFTGAGDMWVANSLDRVNAFTHPFSDASTPSAFVTNAALVGAVGVALDAAQNLYVSNRIPAPPGPQQSPDCNLLVYAPPYTGAPIVTPGTGQGCGKLAVSATRLFLAKGVSGTTNRDAGHVAVYNLPITAASVPAFDLLATYPQGIALDAAGNLYVGYYFGMAVYSAPITANSVPSLTLFPGSPSHFNPLGIAVGK